MKTAKIMAILVAVLVAAGTALAGPVWLASIENSIQAPVRVALDSTGNVYVTDAANDVVMKYSASGQLLGTATVPYPLGIAVDSAGTVYVGSGASDRSQGRKNAVYILKADLTRNGKLGSGDGEVSFPNDIAVDADGNVYVADWGNHVVKVYNPAAGTSTIWGGYGSANGMFRRPIGIAVNDSVNEVYVLDSPLITVSSAVVDGARIQVFTKGGVFLRAIGQYGTSTGQMMDPVGIAVDKNGLLYVTDGGSFRNCVHILNAADGTPVGVGDFNDSAKPMLNIKGIAISKNNIAYIVSHQGAGNKGHIDLYGLDGYVTMTANPASLAFTVRQFSGNSDVQNITIANGGTGSLNWSETASSSWIKAAQTAGVVGPNSTAALSIGIDASSLTPGSYAGTVTITSDFGATQNIAVTVNVLPPLVLDISNGWLNFTSKRGTNPAAQSVVIGIDNVSTSMSWSAKSNAVWLNVSPASGTVSQAAASSVMNVSVNTTGMSVGTYSGAITVSAPGAVGDGSAITVTLTISAATKISVATNRSDAAFTVSGPASYSGSGMNWSVTDAPAGDYVVVFNTVAGSIRPLPQTKALPVNGEVSFSGSYTDFKAAAARKNIVTAKGASEANDSMIKAFRSDGSAVSGFDFSALSTMYGASVAVGDIDGDGTAEIVVGTGGGANPGIVRVYRADKSKVLEFTPFTTQGGVHVAAADLDADGKAEILVATAGDEKTAGTVRVYSLDVSSGVPAMAFTGIELAASDSFGAVATAADTEGDQHPRIITAPGFGADSSDVTIWTVDTSRGNGAWTAKKVRTIAVDGKRGASLAAADTDGDFKDEIIVGVRTRQGDDSNVIVLKSDGAELNRIMVPGADHGVTVVAADLNGDGLAEIAIGVEQKMRDARKASGAVRVYSAAGALQFAVKPFDDAKGEVNMAIGDLGL